jgi:outer membrane protein assembly factor BamB
LTEDLLLYLCFNLNYMPTNKVLILFALICAVCLSAKVSAQTPTIKWWYNLNDASFGQTAAADIDNDGKLELVFGCYRNDSSVYALNAENGTLLWKYNTHPEGFEGCNDVAPIIYDVDNDGSMEVIVPSSCNAKTYCFDGATGAVKWQTTTHGSDSPPTIADIDKDGKPEILHGEFGGYVICINAEDGSVAWEITVNSNSWIQTAPTIVDLDNNGQLDFVVASWAFSQDTNYVYAYRGNDHTLLWKHKVEDVVYHGTAVADLDSDNRPELVIGDYSGKLHVLNGENGTELWTHTAPKDYYIGCPAAIADLDDNGSCEVVFAAWFQMTALQSDSSILWQYSIPDYASAFRGAALADVDNDNKPDVIFGTSTGTVIALKGTTGAPIWSIDLAAHYGDTLDINHAPIIADFDGDGILDLFIIGGDTKYPDFQNNYGRAYALSIGVGAGPDWLMFQRNIRRTSSLCELGTVGISDFAENHPEGTLQVHPNPAKNTTILSFSNAGNRLHSLQIYNALGQKVQTYKTITGTAAKFEISGLPSGLYFFTLLSENTIIGNGKFVVE